MMGPIKVTAHMRTGQIATTDMFLPLDSVLAFAWMRAHHPAKLDVEFTPEDYIEPDLPLARRGRGDARYWACSFACGEPRGEEVVYWHKRFDEEFGTEYVDFQGRRGKVDIKAGHYKSYRTPLVVVLMPKVEWYAVGDKDEVERLLALVTHLGKKRSQGYGRVQKWTVESWSEDLSHLRAIPDPDGDYEMGIRPPYWWSDQWSRCRLSDDPRLACNYMWKR